MLALALASVLLRIFPVTEQALSTTFPSAFAVSSLLLLIGSGALARATHFVRRERQVPFRRHLLIGLGAGTLFVTSQTYALTWLIRQQHPDDVPISSGAFVVVLAALHAMHFVVAMLFLVFITVQAFADRYDHEYYWGVTVCTRFWHALGIAWVVVLGVIAITSLPGDGF